MAAATRPRRIAGVLGALAVLVAGLLLGIAGPAAAAPAGPYPTAIAIPHVMFKNVQTGKCLTIAGGSSTENNVHALQFTCDNDFSRQWLMTSVDGGASYQIKNERTL
ncbi:RICIN domain-containing protein [Pseudonocardia sp. TRM90224]|uniref:RICIN domain-containing protein n=1 Tax=Pseudonocardia sp. TRM90224 TaxID=2812678 RepID=UPI001E3E08E5|nr:RICIN domain-containing protein [Pseudonocardia sp. TRM90224]